MTTFVLCHGNTKLVVLLYFKNGEQNRLNNFNALMINFLRVELKLWIIL